jgi:mRNA-degrading endonuclease RelE of RelBE toxin-antitoxin system
MSYNVIPTEKFKSQAKRLAKKYISLKDELSNLTIQLKTNPLTGIFLGNSCYKIKMAVKSKHRGKTGGIRIITYNIINDNEIYLLTIYDKSEIESINKKEISQLINQIF